MRKAKDITSQKFGRWLAIKFSFRKGPKKRIYWLCKCDCGTERSVELYSLLKGSSTSCGCYVEENPNRTTHGFCGTRFYTCWKAMRQRCYYEKSIDYPNYGGRGITVCDSWHEAFENFRDDMYESYLAHVKKFGEKNTTLDRIDPNKNYSLDNCKWATIAEQNRNTRVVNKSGNFDQHRYWQRRLASLMNRIFYKYVSDKLFIEAFGINVVGFKQHIEAQFTEGMTWNNHGQHNLEYLVWEFDHIIPCNQFDLAKEADRKTCFHYTNLKPIWSTDNRSSKRKKDTILYA